MQTETDVKGIPFAAALAKLRELKGLSQAQLGAKLGLQHSTISKWERETNVPIRTHYDALVRELPELALANPPIAQNISKPGYLPGSQQNKTEPTVEQPEVVKNSSVSIVHSGEWTLYQHKGLEEATVRDIDLAERAGLEVPRDVRRTIRGLIEANEISLVGGSTTSVGGAHAGLDPCAIEVAASYEVGSGTVLTTTEYHLNETAALLVIMRLRTEKAAIVRRSMVVAFALLRQGRLAEATMVAKGQTPLPGSRADIELQLANLKELEALGIIDQRTAAVQRAVLIGKITGFDPTAPLNVTFPIWSPVEAAISKLAPGERVVVTKPVDISGTYSAKAVAQKLGVSEDRASKEASLIGKIARVLGIHENQDDGGKWGVMNSYGDGNGGQITHWRYSQTAIQLIAPNYKAVKTALLSHHHGESIDEIIDRVVPVSVDPVQEVAA